jgi:hypothetical protein
LAEAFFISAFAVELFLAAAFLAAGPFLTLFAMDMLSG